MHLIQSFTKYSTHFMVTDYFAKMPPSKCMYLHDIIVEVSKALPHINNLIIMTVMYVFIKLVDKLTNVLAELPSSKKVPFDDKSF